LDVRGRKSQENGEDYIMRSIIVFQTAPNIIRVMKSRRMKWAGNIAHVGEMRYA
jgi:hypothetical protein